MRSPPAQASTLSGVFLLSVAMLAFELTLTRLFALAQFYHFAFMVVSLALLGLGASGSLLSVRPGLGRHPGWWSAAFALTALASFVILNEVPFDSYAIAWDRRQVLFLVLTFTGTAVPFVFSGLVIGGLLASDARGLHRIYGATMVGSALGSLIVPPLVGLVGAESTVLVEAAIGLCAAGLFWRSGTRARPASVGLAFALISGVILLALAAARPGRLAIRLSPYKALSQALLAPGARHTVSLWTATARIDVVESGSIHKLPGLSQNAVVPRPPTQAGLTVDGDNLTPITVLAPDDPAAQELASHVPQAIVPALMPGASQLILEPAGGWDVLMALAGDATAVTVVERHAAIARILQGGFRHLTRDLYADPRVRVVAVEPRTFVRRTAERFDVVVLALSDSFHPVASGAYSLTEDYRYTVEAMGNYLERLAPGGLLIVTRWLQAPPTESLRTLAGIEAALRRRGNSRPAEHIAAFRSLRTITVLVTNEPLAKQQRTIIRGFAADQGYDLVWLPDLAANEVNRYNRLPTPVYHEAFSQLLDHPQGFAASHEFDIRPSTDDRPFFFHYFRWRQTPAVLAGLGRTWQPFGGSGYLVLVALLILVTLLAAALIAGPLVAGRIPAGSPAAPAHLRVRALTYFALLGLAYMFVLIPLSQRFILFVGQSVTALAVVFFAVLLFSGLGSLTAPRWHPVRALLALITSVVALPLILPHMFDLALGWPFYGRIAVTVLVLCPLGLLMGVPFARGMAIVEGNAPGITAWAWAVNGAASVIGGVLAVMIAVSWGLSVVLWSAALAYVIALLAIRGLVAESGRFTPAASPG